MNPDSVKELLISLKETDIDFSVCLTGKQSKKINGSYNPDRFEILLHNKNFKSDNQLIYTAIHEYAHHLVCQSVSKNARSHSVEFWATFHDLLDIAESKGVYTRLSSAASEKLQQLTDAAKKIEQKIERLEEELAKILKQIYDTCQEDGSMRYEDVVDRELQMSRVNAKRLTANGTYENSFITGDVKKVISAIKDSDKRQEAEQMAFEGKSLDQIKLFAAKKATVVKTCSDETEQQQNLIKEKKRLEKTIQQLQNRLEDIQKLIESKE